MGVDRLLTQVVAGVRYLVHPQIMGTILEDVPATTITPVVVLTSDLLGSYAQKLRDFEKDDVYSTAFSQNLVILYRDGESFDSGHLSIRAFSTIHYASANSTSGGILPGPYFLHGFGIHQAWRLYPDHLDAFIFGVIPETGIETGRFTALGSTTEDGMWKEIAVPSRLYSQITAQKPLAGARVSLKDIFQLAGTKTTMMSRSYSELYGPDDASADYTKKLIELGAVVVGKTKMTQFASSDEPTDQWIDFHCPVNPRGDKYQSPSGSSSGAAASLAGYDWLDFSIAGDSVPWEAAGSVRAPATCNGLYSIRPSVDSTSMGGIIVNSPMFDVVGVFSRELSSLQNIVSKTLNVKEQFKAFPKKIIYPLDFFPHSNPKHQAMVDEFIGILENFLGTKRIEISLADRWQQCPPPEANGKALTTYLSKSAFWPMCYDYYHGFDKFREQYKQKMGKEPYGGPVVEFRWGIGKNVTPAENQQYREEIRVFRQWFDENIMSHDDSSLSDAIMIMPYGSANPKYRDTPNESPSTSHTIGEKFISPVLQMPQLVLPFAQMPYQSRVSGRQEHRPIASTLVGAKGSDLMLIKLARAAFDAAGWPTKIDIGRYMYPLGNNLRNVAVLQETMRSGGEKDSFLGAQAAGGQSVL